MREQYLNTPIDIEALEYDFDNIQLPRQSKENTVTILINLLHLLELEKFLHLRF